MNSINEQENKLFEEWKQKQNYSTFASDGVINPEVWEQQTYKILYVLKEVNCENQDFDLRDFLRNGGNRSYWKTWNNISRWTKGILEGGEYPRYVSVEDKNHYLSKVAAMNLKKVGGDAVAEDETIRDFSRRDARFLQRQINLYMPDLIVCCGRGSGKNADILFEEILPNQVCSTWQQTTNGYNYFFVTLDGVKKTPVLSFYHPQMRGNHEKFAKRYYEIMEAVQEIR